MKRAEINEIIKQELEYIPKGSKGSIQNRLRFQYSAFRRKGITKGKTRQECLKETIDQLKTNNPGFQPEFDKSFFNAAIAQQNSRPGFFRRLLRIGN
jgi:hypothetical protein